MSHPPYNNVSQRTPKQVIEPAEIPCYTSQNWQSVSIKGLKIYFQAKSRSIAPHILMIKMPHIGEHHRHVIFIGNRNHIIITLGATCLNDGGDTRFG